MAVRHFPPWMIEKENLSGFDYDLLAQIFKHMGLESKFIPDSLEGTFCKLKTGDVDVVTSLLFRNERSDFIRYVSPPYKTQSIKSFYVQKDSGINIEKYADLTGLRVGVAKGAKYFPAFDLDDRMVKVVYGSSADSFSALSKSKIDAVICTESVGNYYVNHMGIDSKIRKCSFAFRPKLMPIYIGVSRKSPFVARADEIGAVLRYLQKTGVVDQLARKYSVHLN